MILPYERTYKGIPVVGGDFVVVTDRPRSRPVYFDRSPQGDPPVPRRWAGHHDPGRAIVEGVGSTDRVITSAALIMIAVFGV